MVKCSFFGAAIPPLVLTVGDYIVHDDKTFYLLIPAMYVFLWNAPLNRIEWNTQISNRFPFNWQTPVGYPIALLTQCAGTFSGLICFVPIPCLFIGSSWLISSFIEDVTIELNQHFNDGQFPHSLGESADAETMSHFVRIIQFHIYANKLSANPDPSF